MEADNLLSDKKLQAPGVTIPYAERFEVAQSTVQAVVTACDKTTEHTLHTGGVAGSIPASPTNKAEGL